MILDIEQREKDVIISYYNEKGEVAFKQYPVDKFQNWYVCDDKDREYLRKIRKYAVVVILLAAAIITPSPDWMSQLIVFIPLFTLYELSILVSAKVSKQRIKEEEEELCMFPDKYLSEREIITRNQIQKDNFNQEDYEE